MTPMYLSDNEYINQELERNMKFDCAKLAGIGMLSTLPVVGALLFVAQTCNSYAEYELKKQIRVFLEQLLAGKLTEEDIKRHVERISKNTSDGTMYAEHLLNMLCSHTYNGQARVLATIYRDFVVGKVNKDDFIEFVEINDRMISVDYIELCARGGNGWWRSKECEDETKYRCDRLVALGLLQSGTSAYRDGTIVVEDGKYELTALGKRFAKYAIHGC